MIQNEDSVVVDNTYYLYFYLDPRKHNFHNYPQNSIVSCVFDYEPFYVGKGKGNRKFHHLREVESFIKTNSFPTKSYNKHKFYKIKQIKDDGYEPIIRVYLFNMPHEVACEYEKYYINLIGRSDLNLGPLVNLTDGGEGTANVSDDIKIKRRESFKKTLQENPEISERISFKVKEYYKNRTPEQKENRYKKWKASIDSDPIKKEKTVQKRLQTEKERGSREQATLKCKKTKQDNPSIGIEGGKKLKQYWKDHPEQKKAINKKLSETRIKNRIGFGVNSPYYKNVDYAFIIKCYYEGKSVINIMNEYKIVYKEPISRENITRVFDVCGFIRRVMSNGYFTKKYLIFISENKNKQQWYIDNYKRLEQEYFDKKFAEKHPDFI